MEEKNCIYMATGNIYKQIFIFISGQMPEFFLAENPLLCDCEMEWLQKINSMAQHRQHARVADADQIQCQLNNQYGHSAPVSMMQLKKSDFLCP